MEQKQLNKVYILPIAIIPNFTCSKQLTQFLTIIYIFTLGGGLVFKTKYYGATKWDLMSPKPREIFP